MHEEGARELNVHEPNAIEAVVGWLDAMRRGDIDAAAGWFDPQVGWRGVGGSVCRNRADVLEMLGDSFNPCREDLASFEREPGLCGRIIEVTDFPRRDEALAAAGVQAPGWQ